MEKSDKYFVFGQLIAEFPDFVRYRLLVARLPKWCLSRSTPWNRCWVYIENVFENP